MNPLHNSFRRLPFSLTAILMACSTSPSSPVADQTGGSASVDDAGDGGSRTADGGSPTTGGTGGVMAVPLVIGECTAETPANPEYDDGLFSCKEGIVHRKVARTCSSGANLGGGGAGSDEHMLPSHPLDQCTSTSDCPDGSRCTILWNGGLGTWNVCKPFCTDDSDCGPGSICNCSTAECVSAECQTDAECGEGLCIVSPYYLGAHIGSTGFHCQTPTDQCHVQADCSAAITPPGDVAYCSATDGGAFTCEFGPEYVW